MKDLNEIAALHDEERNAERKLKFATEALQGAKKNLKEAEENYLAAHQQYYDARAQRIIGEARP